MSRIVSRGYVEPSPDCFRPSPWIITPTGHEALTCPVRIDNWDYATDLLVERAMSIDIEAVRGQAYLEPRDDVQCIIHWSCTSTDLQGASEIVSLNDGSADLHCKVPGSEIGGILKLKTTVSVRLGEVADRNPLAARRSGAVLWSDDFMVVLEGDATRFPTEVLSFKANGSEPVDCAWRVEVETHELEAPALAAVRVILNTDHPAYLRLSETPDSKEAALTRQFLSYDVARQLVTAALMDDDFRATEYERGSIGNILRARLQNYFDGEGDEVEPLRRRWRERPADIDAELQQFFLLGDENE